MLCFLEHGRDIPAIGRSKRADYFKTGLAAQGGQRGGVEVVEVSPMESMTGSLTNSLHIRDFDPQ
jgi:hypothetical protein